MFDDPIVDLAMAVFIVLLLPWGAIEALGMLADRWDRLEREARRAAASPAAEASPRPDTPGQDP